MKKFILFFLLVFSVVAPAQVAPIQADRPDQTETPAIVPKGMFQVESGFGYQKMPIMRLGLCPRRYGSMALMKILNCV